MLKNYFTIAWRHLTRNRAYTVINIAGLATGMAIALLIGLWIIDELSFDHYFTNHQRVAKVLITQSNKSDYYTNDEVQMPLGPALHDQYKDLFSRTALTAYEGTPLFYAGEKIVTGDAIWAQSDLPAMFGFEMLEGSIDATKDPSTAIISQSLATALFGKNDPMGQTFKVSDQTPLRVGGVYTDLPHNSTFYNLKAIFPWYNQANSYHNSNTSWQDHNGTLFVELQPGVTPEQATARIKDLPTPYFKTWREEAMIYSNDRFHLYNDLDHGKLSGGAIRYVWLFGLIGAFVLGLACINFMNLSTARSEKRAKEVGIRKTVGSLTGDLITQFLSESILVAFLSLLVALVLTEAALGAFNILAAKDMHIPWDNPLFWGAIAAFTIGTGLLAGSYPAFYLSRFKPVKVLKGDLTRSRTRSERGTKLWPTFIKAGRNAALPRKILVVLQFTVSLTLIIGTIIVYRQILFVKDRPVGYTRNGLFWVALNTPDLNNHYEALRTELIGQGLAANVGASNMTTTGFNDGNGLDWPGKTADQEYEGFRNVNVSPDYGRTIGWTILQGRDFSRDYPTDSSAMVLNAAAAKVIGFKDPIGQIVTFFGKKYHIIGVAADMVTNSPYGKIEPAIFCGGRYVDIMLVRIQPGLAASTALAKMEPVFKKYNPSSPFMYQFADNDYAKKFDAEERIGNLAAVFTTLAIFISCLGLFGLAAFVAEQRTKEIGVRKVLGAGILSLWSLLNKDFLILTSLSMLIAIPLAWLGMDRWLANYPYHTPMSWWIFASAGAGIVLITVITVSFQSIKAALMNPVRSLRSE